MMKLLRQAVALCAFVAMAGVAVPSVAADAPKQAEKKEAPKDIVLKGDAKCTTCHDENDSPRALQIGKTRHGVTADKRTPGCTNCHGESTTHEKEAGRGDKKTPPPDVSFTGKSQTPVQARNDACLKCHEKDSKRMHWAGSQHQARDVACTSCHSIHTGKDRVLAKATQQEVCFTCHKTERAQTHRISTHPLAAGKVACSDCHNPHGSVGPKLLVKQNVNETCYTCHTEKRGPFLWEHASANDDCMNCHTPHGSTNSPLLKTRAPFLCESCHFDTRHPSNMYSGASLPGGTVSNINPAARNNPPVQLAYRACANCHSQVHGSNHPGGQYFLR